jgi:hypothetical protein
MFSAYGDFYHFPGKVQEGCQRTRVSTSSRSLKNKYIEQISLWLIVYC